MTGRPERRYVDDVARQLFAPLLKPRPEDASWRLLSWDAEQGLCLTILRGKTVLLVELEAHDDERDCYARTARFNVHVRRQFEGDTALDAGDRRLVDAIVRMIRQREPLLPSPERAETGARAMVREITVERVLTAEGRGHYYINPYAGCAIGCAFCYVEERADLSRALEGLPRMPWGRWVDVKVNAAEVLRREVLENPPGLVRLSPVLTDPYQALERRYRVTRGCLEVLLDAGYAPVILTRAARVLDDLPLLARFPRAAVGFSIPSDDDRMRRAFEPGADPVERRFEALEALHAAGVRTFAVIQPILPMDVDALVERLAPVVSAIRFDRLQMTAGARALVADAGLEERLDDGFFTETEARLRAGFEARGVPVDEMDELVRLVGGAS